MCGSRGLKPSIEIFGSRKKEGCFATLWSFIEWILFLSGKRVNQVFERSNYDHPFLIIAYYPWLSTGSFFYWPRHNHPIQTPFDVYPWMKGGYIRRAVHTQTLLYNMFHPFEPTPHLCKGRDHTHISFHDCRVRIEETSFVQLGMCWELANDNRRWVCRRVYIIPIWTSTKAQTIWQHAVIVCTKSLMGSW